MQFFARICKTLQPLLLYLSSKMSNHSFKYSLPILPPPAASRHQVLQLRSFLIQIAKNFHLLHILEIWYLFTFIQFSFRVGSFCIAVKRLDYWTMFSKLSFVNHTENCYIYLFEIQLIFCKSLETFYMVISIANSSFYRQFSAYKVL